MPLGDIARRQLQSKYIVKVTFDSRQISKSKAQTEVMLLLIERASCTSVVYLPARKLAGLPDL